MRLQFQCANPVVVIGMVEMTAKNEFKLSLDPFFLFTFMEKLL